MDTEPSNEKRHGDFPSLFARPRNKFHVATEFAAAVDNAVRLGLVGRHPTYLLDFAIWPHRAGGPGCGRVLVTWDGLALGQVGVQIEPAVVFNDPEASFEVSFHDCQATQVELENLRRRWHELRPVRYPWSMGDSEIASN
jgi:hypothetical protein